MHKQQRTTSSQVPDRTRLGPIAQTALGDGPDWMARPLWLALTNAIAINKPDDHDLRQERHCRRKRRPDAAARGSVAGVHPSIHSIGLVAMHHAVAHQRA